MVAAGILALMLYSIGSAMGAPIILNEYNAVRSDLLLDNGASSDPYFGPVAGNGGDWMEFVVIQDYLDLRGWQFATAQNGAADATIVIPFDAVFSNLRSGTILTIAEDVTGDYSYNPVYDAGNPNAGDWWINYQASFSSGDATHTNFQVTVLDTGQNGIFGPAGEGVWPTSGVGSTEVFKLEENPTQLVTPLSIGYKDGTSSTFGGANIWSSGTYTQDLSQLRSAVVPEPTSMLGLALGVCPLALRFRKSRKQRI